MSNNDINEANIFKELSGELDFGDIKQDSGKQDVVKDSIYYMGKVRTGLFYTNIVFLFVFILLISYINIQKSETLLNNSLLNPICFAIQGGDISSKLEGDCSSITALSNKYRTDLETLKTDYFKKVSDLLPVLYSVENFVLSKDVKFIIEKSDSRTRPLEVLSSFDKMKNIFVGSDKGQIVCNNIEIDSNDNLSMACTAFTPDWSDSIQSADSGKKISGTSISLASSFISYIEKNSKNFEILEKPKSFSREDYTGVGYYTKKTDFNLRLKYYKNNTNNF